MKRVVFLVFLASFLAAWGFAQADLQPAAIVNLTRSEPITVKQFRTEVERMERSVRRSLTEQERREVLDAMINEKLAIQAAERDRITVSENEINTQVNQLRAQMVQVIGRQPTDAEFATAMRNETGLELPAFREQLRRQLIVQKYLMSQKQSIIENVKVPTGEEIVDMFNLSRSDFVRPETVRFSMIQVPFGADAAAKTRARELADRMAREIGGSASKFDEVALRGQAANSGYQAGDGGYLPRNREAAQVVGQEFISAAFSLSQGEVSRVIEGQIGYQIIKITETYAMRNLELDDIFQLGTRVTVREYIRNTLLQRRQMEVLAQASQELVSELRAGRTFQVFDRNLAW
ncbi:MAG: SurA N-terminal domain-containing protein [Treponema sp.]|jgi:parvulin-like peptidyl-prolyl isomerase|nr:SurA N-terminal domain-containing protein [Treponema sp.]